MAVTSNHSHRAFMKVGLAALIFGAAMSVGPAEAQPVAPPGAGESSRSGPSGADAGVGFGGTDESGGQAGSSDAAEESAELRRRLRELEQTVEQQNAALAQTREQLQQLQTRLEQQEALSSTVEQRTIATEQQQRVDRSGQRTAAIQSALEQIVALQQLVEAGSDSIGPGLSMAIGQLESAASDAGRWGSTAEAGHLTAAAQLVRPLPAMIASRNFQNASVALYAAQREVTSALALARSVALSR
jgi:hypothetical protein